MNKRMVRAAVLCAGVALSTMSQAQIATAPQAEQGVEQQDDAISGVPPTTRESGASTDDIIVTATKRASPLESVPVAVSVVSGETIRNLNLNNLDQLSRQTPSLSVTEGGEQTGVSIRGFSAGLNFGFDPAVGLFVDGIYGGRERQFRGTFLDVGRVEVLRGPQAALFGKNTSAGAVLITSGQPVDRLEGFVRTEYVPRSDRLSTEGVLNVPLTSNLAGRLAVRVAEEQGFFYNTYTREREEQIKDFIIRGTLLWRPIEGLSVRLKGEYSDYDRVGRAFQISQISGAVVGRPLVTTTQLAQSQTPTVPFAQGELPRPIAAAFSEPGLAARLSTYLFYDPLFEYDKNYQLSKQRETAEVHARNALLEVNYDFGAATITSVTGYSAYNSDDGRDVDWNPTPFLYQPITQDYTQWSEELRLTSKAGGLFEWLVGAFFLKQDFFVDRQTDVDINLFFNPIIDDPNRKYATIARFAQDTYTTALFGSATLNFTDDLHLSVGARISRERKEVSDLLDYARFQTTIPLDPNNPADAALLATAASLAPAILGQRHANTAEAEETNFTPEARLAYDLPGGGLAYLSYARGVRSGGFNSGSISPTETDFFFGAETTDAYEVGTKLVLFGGSTRINLAGFYQTFRDLQTSVYTGESFDLRNAGRSRTMGIEADASLQLSRRLNVNGGFLILRSKFIENTGVGCNITQQYFGQPGCSRFGNGFVQDLSGQRFGPRFNASANVTYTLPVTEDVGVELLANMVHRGTSRGGNDPDVDQPPTTNFNLGATLQSQSRGWYIGALLENATDVQNYFFEFEAPSQVGSRIGFLQPPRRLTFRIGTRF